MKRADLRQFTLATVGRAASRPIGFTLIEVMAALLLIGIVLPVAMRGITLATTAGTLSRQRNEAAALAETRLTQLVVTQSWQTGNLSGDFTDLGDEWSAYHWSAQQNTWIDPSQGTQGLTQLDLTVTWPFRNDQRSVTVSTVVYTSTSASGTSGSSASSSGSSTGGTK